MQNLKFSFVGRRFILIFSAFFGLSTSSPPPAHSAEKSISSEPALPQRSLRDVIATGLKRSPRIKKVAADFSAAENATDAAKGTLLPNISAKGVAVDSSSSGGGSDSDFSEGSSSGERYQAYLDAYQPLFSTGVSAGLNLMRNAEDIQRQNLELETRQYIRDLANAYFNVAEETLLLAATEQNIATLKRHSEVISRYTQIGRAQRTDRLQTQVNLSTAMIELSESQARLVTHQERLRELLALDEVFAVETADASLPKTFMTIENTATVVQNALARHPSVKIAELQVARIESEKGVDLAEDMPSLFLRGQWGYRSTDRDQLFENSNDYSQISLDLTIPIFSGLSSMAKRRGFVDREVSATRQLESVKASLVATLRAKVRELESYNERLPLARDTAREAQQALDIGTRDYSRSLISSLDVTNLQRTRYEADRLWVRTRYSYARALLDYRELAGEDLKKIYAP